MAGTDRDIVVVLSEIVSLTCVAGADRLILTGVIVNAWSGLNPATLTCMDAGPRFMDSKNVVCNGETERLAGPNPRDSEMLVDGADNEMTTGFSWNTEDVS